MLVLMLMISACSEDASKEVDEESKSDSNDSTPPSVSDLDPDDPMSPYIEDGKELLYSTMSDENGSELSCMSCHADGTGTNGVSLVGVTSQFPKYEPREGTVVPLVEHINNSITRTLNAEKLEYDGEEMRSIVAYLTYISEGIEVGSEAVSADGEAEMVEIPEPDLGNGEEIYEERIAESSPELWGEFSFTDGSNMSRMSVMTNYVKNYLPEDEPGSLSEQEAADVAGYILSKDRPEWEEHDSDWPDGDRPSDLITKKEREEIKEGTFDWSQINED